MPFGFVAKLGYQTDEDSGLMLLGHRFYDPSIGRFLCRDPIHAGANDYAYCDNNPVSAVDPSGEQPFSDGTGLPVSNIAPTTSDTAASQTGPGSTKGAAAGDPKADSSTATDGKGTVGSAIPPDVGDKLNKLSKTVDNISRDIAKLVGELKENNGKLPERVAGDKVKPSISKGGHRGIISDLKRIKWLEMGSNGGNTCSVWNIVAKNSGSVPIFFVYISPEKLLYNQNPANGQG